jgi:2,4-dienoyl-CoA reductase-like NADH-dependent reductase (Old Yellow Enzyme family)
MSSAGMFTIEATAVTAEGRITYGCLGLYDDACEAALADKLHRARKLMPPMPVAIQLAHAGRKASSRRPWEGGSLITLEQGGWEPVAPSAVPIKPEEAPPARLDRAAVNAIRDAFAESARRAQRIGIDAVELHMAHGYLLHEFLSPIANHRNDDCGGSFDNRIRFPLDVFDAVRAVWPASKPLGVRLSCTDWVSGGWTLEESIELSRRLVARGCDWIDCSSGGVSPAQKIPLAPGYQVPFAREIRRATGVTTVAVGLITDAIQAATIVSAGDADLVCMARAFLWNPRWPWHAAAQLVGSAVAPPQYWRSVPREAQKAFSELRLGQR